MTKLISCPFCGAGEGALVVIDDEHEGCAVVCTLCRANGPAAHDDESASERWNERADEGVDPDALRVLQERLGLRE